MWLGSCDQQNQKYLMSYPLLKFLRENPQNLPIIMKYVAMGHYYEKETTRPAAIKNKENKVSVLV